MRAAEEFGGHDLQRANRDAHLGKKKISREIKKKKVRKKAGKGKKGMRTVNLHEVGSGVS